MLGKFLCQSLVSPTGLALASLAHLRAFYGKDMSQKNEVLFDRQQYMVFFSSDNDEEMEVNRPSIPFFLREV